MLDSRQILLGACFVMALRGVYPSGEETLLAAVLNSSSGGQEAEHIDRLIRGLQAIDEFEREDAIEGLGKIGPAAARAVPAILAAVAHFNQLEDYVDDADFYGIPDLSIDAIGKIGEPAVPYLIDAVKTGDSGLVRFVAAAALGEIGPAAEPAIPSLVEVVKLDDEGDDKFPENVSGAALASLSKIGTRAIPALVDLFAEDNQRLKQMAAMGMANVRPAYQKGVTLIVQEIRRSLRPPAKSRGSRENYFYVEALIVALGEFGEAAGEAVPLLVELQQDRDFRVAATNALERIEPR